MNVGCKSANFETKSYDIKDCGISERGGINPSGYLLREAGD